MMTIPNIPNRILVNTCGVFIKWTTIQHECEEAGQNNMNGSSKHSDWTERKCIAYGSMCSNPIKNIHVIKGK